MRAGTVVGTVQGADPDDGVMVDAEPEAFLTAVCARHACAPQGETGLFERMVWLVRQLSSDVADIAAAA